MESVIIVLLVIGIIALGFYAWILRRRVADEARSLRMLSREKEQEQHLGYELERKVKQQEETILSILKHIDTVLNVDTSMYHTAVVSDFTSTRVFKRWRDAIGARIQEYKAEVAKGNRRELEDRLREFWEAIGYTYFPYEEFMHEFTTLPQAALNRIIVKVTRG